MSKETVVVTGATGHVGGHLSAILADAGYAVRGVASNAERVPSRPNVEVVTADLRDPHQAEKAVRDAAVVYITPVEAGPRPLALERKVSGNLVSAAQQSGVEHIIVHTALFADRGDTGVPLIDVKSHVERVVAGSRVPFTILRPGVFLETLLGNQSHAGRGRLRLPFAPGHRFGAVSAYDVARVARRLVEKGPQGRGFDLHRPDGISGTDLARIESETFDRVVEYEEFTGPAESYVGDMSIGPEERTHFAALFDYIRTHDYLGAPDEIRTVLAGFEYTPIERVLHRLSGPRRQEFEPASAAPGR